MQTTLAAEIHFAGTGLHSGKPVRMVIKPAPANHGLVFVRTDCDAPENTIPVTIAYWVESSLCTVLRNPAGVSVSTIEHLLAALHGCGVHNARIEIDAPEVPILDGSAAPFVRRFLAVGLVQHDTPLHVLRILKPVSVTNGEASASLSPASTLEIDFSISFADPAIGDQRVALPMHNGTFLRELSDCRTFCMRKDVDLMQANGLALGGTLDNAVVFDSGTVLTPGGLRREDEPVRHKMLDAMGDLYVAGLPIVGRYHGIRAGHALTGRLLQTVLADPDSHEIVPCDASTLAQLPGTKLSARDLPLSA